MENEKNKEAKNENGKWKKGWERYSGSVMHKIFFSMLLCIMLLMVFNWLLNNLVLERYYREQKEDVLEEVFWQIDDVYGSNLSTPERQLQLDIINGQHNCTIIVFDRRAQVVYVANGGLSPDGTESLRWYFTGELNTRLEPGTYEIHVAQDERVGQEYLTLSGALSDRSFLMLRAPLQAISEGVQISNQFLLISGALTILLGGVLFFWIARSLTRPIQNLMFVTEGLAQLDFSRKYTGKSRDELGRMGQRINQLSTDLERTLSELKTLNAQLERDNEIKTKQDQLRRDFIANASHELKTPIALIRAYAEGISEDVSSDPESRRMYCEIIQDEADKMNLLIKKMTSLMQLESGEEELTISRFQINELIDGVLRNYSILLDQKKITQSFVCTEDLYCWGDEYFIENVINNYVSNAANHVSEKGEIVVEAHRKESEDGGRPRVRVSVFNTGEKIAEEDLSRIWESFYKVDKARSRQYGGTGLGLSVVSAIMRAHNMPCGVENVDGGVRFWFELEIA